ncbi:MAG: hypothetical protein E6K76_11585 [Candidatus Eisenbacteria bacterium]|uniref:Dipeptidylpeptidase IV N-terminal domain-containing protein n=1 Tax=Eiseniibacteriota bacterium TaxID=2212470 RepID=A0A538T098_UNCEI|nr:MAG: hypothetical protein E6K76_11585 [Candidatus Eisenbacteria bacterium]
MGANPMRLRWLPPLSLILALGCDQTSRFRQHDFPIVVVESFAPYGSVIWAADGQHLLFNHRPLARIQEIPPGSHLYYYIGDSTGAGIGALDLASETMRRVYPAQLGGLELSHDGQFLYYEAQGQVWRITVQADSLIVGSEMQVTNSSEGAFGPSVSNSGTRLLYYVGTGRGGIRISAASGGGDHFVGPSEGWISPDWQPNDSSFAFVRFGSSATSIAVVDTFGVQPVSIQANANSPKWSPDGTHIAFLSRGSDLNTRDKLWLMNRDGSGVRQLTTESVAPEFNWSPDGTRIAYVRFIDNDTSYVNGTIWLIDPMTLDRYQVTFNRRP